MPYNPSLHTTSNKPYGIQGLPIDARSYFYDESLYSYRVYNNNAEVLSYLNIPDMRRGHFSIFIKDNLGVIYEWWFKDGVADIHLVKKMGSSGVGSTPVTFIEKTLTTEEEVILEWDTFFIGKHGIRPVYIDLFNISSGSVQSTSRVYTEDCGETYRWYVGSGSSRRWEIRVMGYTEDSEPCDTDEYVVTGYWINGYTDINEI